MGEAVGDGGGWEPVGTALRVGRFTWLQVRPRAYAGLSQAPGHTCLWSEGAARVCVHVTPCYPPGCVCVFSSPHGDGRVLGRCAATCVCQGCELGDESRSLWAGGGQCAAFGWGPVFTDVHASL